MAIYRGGQKIKELRFGGSQKIKEAYVGSQLVFKGGWDAVPNNGIMFTRDGAFVSYSGITYTSNIKRWSVSKLSTGTISNIVFGENTTEMNLAIPSTGGNFFKISIDGEFVGDAGASANETINVPGKFIDGNAHTITIKNTSTANHAFTAFNFNV